MSKCDVTIFLEHLGMFNNYKSFKVTQSYSFKVFPQKIKSGGWVLDGDKNDAVKTVLRIAYSNKKIRSNLMLFSKELKHCIISYINIMSNFTINGLFANMHTEDFRIKKGRGAIKV